MKFKLKLGYMFVCKFTLLSQLGLELHPALFFSFKLADHKKCNTISWKKTDDYIIDHKLLTHGDLLHSPIQLSEDLTRHFVSKYKACIFPHFV